MKSRIRKVFAIFIPFLFPLVAFAAGQNCEGGANGLCNPLGYASLTEFLRRLLQLVAEIGFPVIVLFIVFIGFRFITSSGKPDELKKVRELFFWAIVGALIVLGAEALSLAIQATVNQLQG